MEKQAPIMIPVTFDSANRRKDRSVRLAFTSNLEINTLDFSIMDSLVQSAGWLLFSQNEISAQEVPKEEAPSDLKRPSVRMRAVIYRIWEQNTDKSEPFENYYHRSCDSIIEKLKERLA